MTHQSSGPSELRLTSGGRRLEISWDESDCAKIAADSLRAASRSAGAVRAHEIGGRPVETTGVTITDIQMVGSYAVRLTFSDGHDRGIFPWRYLRDLAAV